MQIEETDNTEEQITTFIKRIFNAKDMYLNNYGKKHTSWMTKEILLLIEERIKQKNSSSTIEKHAKGHIQKKIREAKQQELDDKCQEIEVFKSRFNGFNVHRKVRAQKEKYGKTWK